MDIVGAAVEHALAADGKFATCAAVSTMHVSSNVRQVESSIMISWFFFGFRELKTLMASFVMQKSPNFRSIQLCVAPDPSALQLR